MIVKSLVLHNFGLYVGDHRIDLSQTTGERPIILIGGLNGRGKTTILEALLLGLYGRQSFAVTTSKLSYNVYLQQHISAGAGAHDASVEIQMQINPEQPVLTIHRAWSDREYPITDQLSIYSEGNLDPYLSENWATFMETVLPAGISKLFFFDGEKIMELANDQTDEELKSAIKSLLGIDTIDRLIYDLGRVVARQDLSEHHGNKDLELETLKEALSKEKQEETQILDQLSQLKRHMNDLVKEEQQFHQEITKHSGNLVQSKVRYESDLAQVGVEKQETIHRLLEKVSGPLPLVMVMPLLRSLLKRAQKEQLQRQRRIASTEIQSLQEKVEQLMRDRECQTELSQAVSELFKPYLEPASEKDSLGIEISDHAVILLGMLNNEVLQLELDQVKGLIEQRCRLEKKNEMLEQYINRADLEIEVQEVYEKLRACMEKQSIEKQRRISLEQSLTEINSAIKRDEKAVRFLKQHMMEEEQGRVKESRTVRYANTAIQIMEVFRTRIQHTKVERLSGLITERFLLLSEKQDLISFIKINPDTLEITLQDSYGEALSIAKLSAGERQMLVIALLWGLASSLENPLPIVIDTPLSRLDSKHRENFVKKYLPNASHQVIVLSTDEEINGAYTKMIAPYTAASYLLQYDSEKKQSSIQEGYFKGEA